MDNTKPNILLLAVIAILVVILLALVVLLFIPPDHQPVSESPELSIETDEMPVLVNEEQGDEKDEKEWPLLFATMTHMEGNWPLAETNEIFFTGQAKLLRKAMQYAEEYDAILTFESEIPFAKGMVNFNDNVFQEALDRGMGIGTHCDIYPKEALSIPEIIEEFAERKAVIDALVDPSENLHCSGGGGMSDWYAGAVGAGFKFLGGTVGYHYLAMPEQLRPEGWDDRSILFDYFHDPAPVEEELRYYPFRVDGADFFEDSEGELVISAGAMGQLAAMGEKAGQDGWDASCGQDCPLDQLDVDTLVNEIIAFDANRDRSRPAKLLVYIPTKLYKEENIELFFEAMQELQDQGVITWASQKQVYETFLEWEKSQ
jgi:hypothetical protein